MVIDTQSVRAAAGVPRTTTGLDVNKRTPGRKRGPAVDGLGPIIGVVVLAASAHENAAGTALLDQATERCGMRPEKALVDQGFKDEAIIHGALLDVTVEVVRRDPADQGKGFVPQPKRWVVEQVNGYQAIVNAFNQHSDQAFRVRELHELLGMPTHEPALNVTRSRLGRLTRQGFLAQPGRGRHRKRTQHPLQPASPRRP